MTLYQSGIAQDVLLNLNPIGVTENGMFRINLGQILNFRNSVFQFLCGSVKLVGHRVTGIVGATLTYSLSGQDEAETGIAPDDEEGGEESATAGAAPKKKRVMPGEPRNPRATPGIVTGTDVTLNPGLSLARRLAAINAAFNKDYRRRKDGDKFGKISLWPVTVCMTHDGLIRSKWSGFAILASDDVNFFRQLGYADSQIFAFNHEDNRLLYALGPMPVEKGDVTAVNPPQLDAVSLAPATFYLVPRKEDMKLRLECYAYEIPAIPSALKVVLDLLIANANYKYRVSVLEQVFEERYIWPATSEHFADDTGVVSARLYPYNIFPIVTGFGADKITLDINTKENFGSVRDIAWDERNIFGLSDHYSTWDPAKRRNKQTSIESTMPLGVRSQICEISSTQVFQSRASLTSETVNAAICALFLAPGQPTTFPMTFFPKNLLASSISYSSLDFMVRSRYVHPTMTVTGEQYDYVLVAEIRGVD